MKTISTEQLIYIVKRQRQGILVFGSTLDPTLDQAYILGYQDALGELLERLEDHLALPEEKG